VFAQYQQLLAEHQPDLVVKGDNYPPPGFRLPLSHLIGALKMAALLMLVISFDPWAYIGHEVLGPTPQAYIWALENKIFACLMVFFLANMVETQLISTGAFEVSVGGDLVWSKLEQGRVPQPKELIPLIMDRLGKAKQAVDATLADQL
jgi:selT/selW/selH-like putative selenoprotein